MRAKTWIVLSVAWFCLIPLSRADIADLKADWSDSANPNIASFGTWSYRQGTSLLTEIPNWSGAGTVSFPTTQPAWAPSNTAGNFLPAAFKLKSLPTGTLDAQVGDVIVHTTDTANGSSNGPVNFLWTSPNTGKVTISGGLWVAATLPGRDNSWSLYANGSIVSSGANIDSYGRSNPFLLNAGTGGPAALTLNVTPGSTIDLQITESGTTPLGSFAGTNFTITGIASVPEPSGLVLGGLMVTVMAIFAKVQRIRRGCRSTISVWTRTETGTFLNGMCLRRKSLTRSHAPRGNEVIRKRPDALAVLQRQELCEDRGAGFLDD